jgi:ribose 5-phosphate isomerase B
LKIPTGSDHAGLNSYEKIRTLLSTFGHEVKEFGTFSAEPPLGFPLFIRPTANLFLVSV